ncbi:Pectinesterase/pectinesterase inhibitor U1 [Nymphaea thermarum]|nr:Pectinesterase/pectinesterase inhibitor U1 [Nymphaea thermarum]
MALGTDPSPITFLSTVFCQYKKISNILFLALLAISFVAGASAGDAYASKHGHHHHHGHHFHLNPKMPRAAHAVVRSSCAHTRYPDLCMSSLTGYSGSWKVSCQKDVIFASLNLTATAVGRSYLRLQKLAEAKGLPPSSQTALRDCLDLMGETLEQLDCTAQRLRMYPSNKSIEEHACDLKILLSAAMTNQDACLEGFSHLNHTGHPDFPRQKSIKKGADHVYRMVSNSLAMVTNMTNSDLARKQQQLLGRRRRLLESGSPFKVEVGFPNWMPAGDRKLLQDGAVAADIVVAADGSGNVRTVTEAINRAPEGSGRRYVIRVKAGVYRENVVVPPRKTNIMLVGDGRGVTVITGSRSVSDGSTTFSSATFGVFGDRFVARDITFQNTAGPSKGQAVALRVGSDFSAFYRCEISGYQDTLYAYSMRQFYRDCTITGTVDFIFGNAAAVFQNCDILARMPISGQSNEITAHARSDPNQNTGFSIQNCRIGGASDLVPVSPPVRTFLGRPWMPYSRVVVMRSNIGSVIDPAGWDRWIGDAGLNTLYYGEYMNTGPGSNTQNRVKWSGVRVMSGSEAERFTVANFLQGGSWVGSTGLPFSLDLS